MKLEESWDKEPCDECGEYGYTWRLRVKDYDDDDSSDGYVRVHLCKKCLVKLLHLIIER